MTSTGPNSLVRDSDLALRDQLSALQGLLALSMLMTEKGDESEILHLATTSVASLAQARVGGVHLRDDGWAATSGACTNAEVRTDLETQFAVLSAAGGALGIVGERWAWGFPLRTIQGHFGYLVVAADDEPSRSAQFLLRVLAQQTGIAVANARLHRRERATAERLRAANVALADTVDALQRSTDIHQCLTRVAVRQEGQEGIARAVHELTGFPVAVEDGHGNLRAWAGDHRPEPYPKESHADRARLLDRAMEAGTPIRDGARLVAVASPGTDVVGVLALVDPEGRAGDQERVALEHGATVLAVELSRLQNLAETERRLGRDLIDQLLAGTDQDSALARAQGLGYDLERPHRVVVVEPDAHTAQTDPAEDALFHAVRRAGRDTGAGSLLVARPGSVVLLADADVPWDRLRAAVSSELGGRQCRLGVGGPAHRPEDFPRSYQQAALALKVQRATGSAVRATVFTDLGVYGLLADGDVSETERFIEVWLGSLLAYDKKKGSNLVATLGHYLECGKSYDATATALAVHRSTLKYRLQRIAELSGHDLSNPDTTFNLQFATRAWQTLQALGA